jgi:hypothetical protein
MRSARNSMRLLTYVPSPASHREPERGAGNPFSGWMILHRAAHSSVMTGWFGAFALSLTRHYSSDASHDREGVVFWKKNTTSRSKHQVEAIRDKSIASH